MKKQLICLLFVMAALGCKKSETQNSRLELHERFHGKYAITSAISNVAVDVNFDGNKSTNLVEEIPDLKQTYLELRLSLNSDHNVYGQFWANQSLVSEHKPLGYDPSVIVMYLKQGIVGGFQFNDDLTALKFAKESSNEPVPEDFSLPESVTIGKDDEITVTMTRTLYTRAGWLPVSIVVKYKRFSKLT